MKIKKINKFLAICSICFIGLFSLSTPVSAADSWAGFDSVYIGLTFGTLGRASFYTTVTPSKDSYYSTINMKLQRYSGGSWHTLVSGTHGDTSVHSYSTAYYVTKGYTYRVYSKVNIYKSKGGAFVNSDTFTYKRSYK